MADVEEHLAKFAHQAITDPVGLRRGHLLQQVLALDLGKFFIGIQSLKYILSFNNFINFYLNNSKLFPVNNFL